MYRLLKTTLPAFLLLAVTFASCVKEVKENQEETQQAVKDIFLAQSAFADGYDNMSEQAHEEEDLNGFNEEADDRACGDATFTTTPGAIFPAVLKLDFAGGCPYNGHMLDGYLTATFDGFLFAEGKSMTIDFTGYSMDGNTLGGNYKLTNLGNNSNGQWQHEHKVSNGAMTDVSGNTFTYAALTTSTMIAGQATNWLTSGLDGITDDVWLEEGSSTYTNSSGTIYNIKTLSPTRREVTCNYPVSGVIEITSENLNNAVEVDFGDGTCDNKINVSSGVLNFEMSL